MCKTCCSHKNVSLPCDPTATFHIAHFPLTCNGILFPSELIYLDAHMASTLHLISDVVGDGIIPSSHTTWPSAELLSDVLAISPSANSMYGALATLQLVSCSRVVRVRTEVIGRYRRISPPDYHRPYACVHAQLICETPPVRLRDPLNVAFPYTTSIRKRQSPTVLTRSASAQLQRTARRRSFAMMGGLSYTDWAALQPPALLRRARNAAMYAGLKVDKVMMDRIPDYDGCPSLWSFWLCAALAEDTKPGTMEDLQAETCVVVRLRKIVELLEQRRLRWKKRSRERDTAYHASLAKPKRRRVSELSPLGPLPNDTNASSHEERKRDGQDAVHEILRQRPWPCSTLKGFQEVDLRLPCKGRFRSLPPCVQPSALPSTCTIVPQSELPSSE